MFDEDEDEDEESVRVKRNKIQDFLEKQFENVTIESELETEKDALQCVLDVLTELQTSNELTKTIIEDVKRKNEEYEMEEKNLRSLLAVVGLNVENVCHSELEATVDALVQMSLRLQLKMPVDINFDLAVAKIKDDESTLEMELLKEKKFVSKLKKDKQILRQKAYELEKVAELSQNNFNSLRDQVSSKRRKMELLSKKIPEYQAKLNKFANKLKESGFRDDFRHETVMTQHSEIMALGTKIKTLKAELISFADLPPDIEITKTKIEEAKKELERLENDLTESIANI